MNAKTKKLVTAALLAALIFVAARSIQIPFPLAGYAHLGDGIVLVAGWMLSPAYGFLAAGLGSALADLLSGYSIYAPATFVIKGLMALVAFYGFKLFHKKIGNLPSRLIGGVAAEAMMILGYFVYEAFVYNFFTATGNLLANAGQGIAGVMVGVVLIKALEKSTISWE